MIFIAQNGKTATISTIFTQVKSLKLPYPEILGVIEQSGQALPLGALNGANWRLTDYIAANRLIKMEAAGIPLGEYVKGQIYRGLLTGCDKAFIVNSQIHQALISLDPNCANVFKPLIYGDTIRKYNINRPARWLIFAPWNFEIDRYPSIKNHLMKYRDVLEKRPEVVQKRYKWYCLGRYGSSYHHLLTKPKIVYPEIAMSSRFAFDIEGTCTLKTVFSITVNDLYLLGILNSRLVWDYLKEICSVLGDAEQRGRLTLQSIYVNKIPIPNASTTERETISQLVQKCLDAKGVDCEIWEKQIDERVAALYGL